MLFKPEQRFYAVHEDLRRPTKLRDDEIRHSSWTNTTQTKATSTATIGPPLEENNCTTLDYYNYHNTHSAHIVA